MILLMIQCGSGRIICMGFQYFLESTTQSSTNNPLMMLQKLIHLLDKAYPCSNETVCLLHTIKPVPTPIG
jgi:hypothetical protein